MSRCTTTGGRQHSAGSTPRLLETPVTTPAAALPGCRGSPVIALAAALLGCNAPQALGTAPAPRPPVLAADFPDPFVLPAQAGLYAYATNTIRNRQRVHVQVAHAPDGQRWRLLGDAMPALPRWVSRHKPDIWAPEVIAAGNRYVLYFAGRHATRQRPDGLTLCIGVATANAPKGPFVALPEPLLCDGFPHGVIDPSPFRDGADLYLYAKSDGNCCGEPTRFYAVKLAADGLRPIAPPTAIAGIVNDRAWEGDVIEAPTMVERRGRYTLFYSANGYGGARYAIGYARCATPTGPCTDADENPILSRDTPAVGPLVGPGHQSIFSFGGRTRIAYHGWLGRPARARAMYIDDLVWHGERPVVRRAPDPYSRKRTPTE